MDSHKRSTQLERLEVVETGRRRRWSDDKKLRIVTESFEAPRAISSTARRHGISRSLLMTWRRAFGPEPISPQSEQSGFARVILAAEVEPAVAADNSSAPRPHRSPSPARPNCHEELRSAVSSGYARRRYDVRRDRRGDASTSEG